MDDDRELSFVLTVESPLPNFTDLKKKEIVIRDDVAGKIFKELSKLDIYFDFDFFEAYNYQYFVKIGAEDFVKKRLRFKDVYGNWKILEEIEKDRSILVVDAFTERYFDKFRDFFDKRSYHALSSMYHEFFDIENTTLKFFEECNECGDCIFGFPFFKVYKIPFEAYKIKDSEFKMVLERNFGNVIIILPTFPSYCVIVDNPFIKKICKLWKERKIKERKIFDIKRLFETIKPIIDEKLYATVEDLEKACRRRSKR